MNLADELMRSLMAERPRLGTADRPYLVRGSRLTECPYRTCGGELRGRERGLYECQGICGNWFEFLPLEGFDWSGAAEWVM